jgi:putative heme degradation protein
MSTTQAERPQNRHRDIAALDHEIGRAEGTRARCVLALEVTEVASSDRRRAQAMLRMAEERLSLLRNSRPVLLTGNGISPPDGPSADAAHS